MKTTHLVTALVAFVPTLLAQSLPPSPTASYGCEPHGDHWHCDGVKATLTGVTASTATAEGDHDHDHEHEEDHEHEHEHDHGEETEEAGPSPSQSVDCERHGDHWHCDGPATAVATPTTATRFTDAAGEGEAGPSPTESFGCVAHGDHYHCEGSRATTTGADSAAATSDDSTGAGMRFTVPVLGLLAAVAAAF